MPTIYSATTDGKIVAPNNTTYSTVRNSTTGTVSSGTASQSFAVEAMAFSGRGATQYRISRSFLHFDTSGITGTVASATMKLYISSLGSGNSNLILVTSDAFTGGSSALHADDFNNIDISAPYSSSTALSTGNNNITLNAAALADIKNNNDFKVAILNNSHDFTNSAPTGSQNYFTLTFADQSGTSIDPQIEYTLATGYGNDVNGVASANIGKVDGVATANIEKVIGV